jgi:hypothetical protein
VIGLVSHFFVVSSVDKEKLKILSVDLLTSRDIGGGEGGTQRKYKIIEGNKGLR